MINVLVVDDHELVRLGIKRLLQDVSGITVVGEAESGEQALQVLRKQAVDIVLLDVRMPGIGGVETTHRILRLDPYVKVIVITASDNLMVPSQILQAGASGFLTKETGGSELERAIKKVHAGEHYISPEIAQKMALRSIEESTYDHGSPFNELSERELQVAQMIVRGNNSSHIAETLHVSAKTVNSYRYRIFTKLDIHNDVELTLLAFRHGLLSADQITESSD